MKILFAARARGETTPPGSGRFLPLNLFLFSPNAGLASRYQPLESGLGPVPLDCLRSGVTEMILGPGYSKLRRNGAWVDDDRAHEAFQVISRTASDEDRHRVGEVLSDQEITDYANVMCGWALGILDFARMVGQTHKSFLSFDLSLTPPPQKKTHTHTNQEKPFAQTGSWQPNMSTTFIGRSNPDDDVCRHTPRSADAS